MEPLTVLAFILLAVAVFVGLVVWVPRRADQLSRIPKTAPNQDYSELLLLCGGDSAKAERLIAYELKRGSRNRAYAICDAVDRLHYDRAHAR